MPITPFHSKSDPFASLASTASSVVLALEKRRQNLLLDEDDIDAVRRISHRSKSLSRANELKDEMNHFVSASVSAEIQSDFFTLVAIQSSSSAPTGLPDFGELAANLDHILEQYSAQPSSPPDVEKVEATQLMCLDFLERINQSRPSFPQQ